MQKEREGRELFVNGAGMQMMAFGGGMETLIEDGNGRNQTTNLSLDCCQHLMVMMTLLLDAHSFQWINGELDFCVCAIYVLKNGL